MQNKLLSGSLFVMLSFLVIGCEKNIVQPEESKPAESLSKARMVISYEQTMIATTPGNSNVAQMSFSSPAAVKNEVLRRFERTHRKMTIHNNGKASLEVEYLEGNSDIQIPMELYRRIKDRLHPADPARKPIARYTIIDDIYTGYAQDGSVVFRKQFTKPPTNPSSGLQKAASFDPSSISAGERIEALKKTGAEVRQLNAKQLLIERSVVLPRGAVIHRKDVFNLETGQMVRSQSYDQQGRLLSEQRLNHERINGLPVPSVIVTHVYGEGSSGWQLQATTVEQRTKITVDRF